MSDLQTEQRVRIFCAVELPEDARARIVAHVTKLREKATHDSLKISWERAEKLHLTLKFLGEVEAGRVEALTRAAGVGGVGKFALSLHEAGAFPARGNPRVLWLGLHDATGRLAQLRERLEAECERENFPREPRAFRPHITIARIRTPNAAARQLAALHCATLVSGIYATRLRRQLTRRGRVVVIVFALAALARLGEHLLDRADAR
jgi:2'-5' RNA ligase